MSKVTEEAALFSSSRNTGEIRDEKETIKNGGPDSVSIHTQSVENVPNISLGKKSSQRTKQSNTQKNKTHEKMIKKALNSLNHSRESRESVERSK